MTAVVEWGVSNLGQIVGTPGAIEARDEHGVDLRSLLKRHASGDWGEVDAHDARVNDEAKTTGARVLSSYGEGDAKLWIITDAALPSGLRHTTTILRPDEY